MLSRNEIERLAAAAHALRPDWPLKSLCTLIARDLETRAYRDVAVALAWIAADPKSRTPKRITEAGPWWTSTAGDDDTTNTRFERCTEPGHGSYPAWNCGACKADQLATTTPRPYAPPADPDVYTTGAAVARAALKETR